MTESPYLPVIVLAGCTGQIGSRLIAALSGRAHLIVLSRSPAAARLRLPNTPHTQFVEADVTKPGLWQTHLERVNAVVNLFGEGILNRRWSPTFKELLLESRVQSTLQIGEALARCKTQAVWINASGAGYYGSSGPEVANESAGPGDDLLARVCVQWEEAQQRHALPQIRKVALRIGAVLDPRAGALPNLAFPFRFFLGGKIGLGTYPVSWIHEADLTGLILHALDHDGLRGPLNATAPYPVTNAELATALGKALYRPALFPVPAWVLRIVLGEVATVISKGRAVLPALALATRYWFRFPTIDEALKDLLGKQEA